MRITLSILIIILLSACSKEQKHDNTFDLIINQIELNYIKNKPDSALYNAKYALFKAKTDPTLQIKALAAQALVYSYYYPNKNDKLIDSIITLSISHKKKYYEAYAHLLQSLTYINTDTKKASECAERSLNIAQTNRIPDLTAYALANKSELLRGEGNETMALVYAIKSKTAFDKILTKLSPIGKYFLGSLANTMGIIYKNRGEYAKALEMYNLYSSISNEIGDEYSSAISLNNIGIVYYRMNDFPRAEAYYMKTIERFKSMGMSEFLGDVYHNLYNLYNDQKDKTKAASAFKECKLFFNAKGNSLGLAKLYLSRATSELAMSNTGTAMKYVSKVSALASSSDLQVLYPEIADIKYQLSMQNGNYSAALTHYQEYRQRTDSLNNARSIMELGSVQENYRLEKQISAEQIARANAEKIEAERIERRNLIEYTAIALIIAIILIITLLIKRKNIKPRLIDAVMFFALLLVFNFISVLFDPLFDNWSNNEPLIQLLLNIALALIITPLDGWLEKKV